MLESGDRVLVGVSGGADSVSLAFALTEIGYPIGIAHLNHGLRGADSDRDESFVVDLAGRLRATVFTERAAIRSEAGNLEAAGRTARQKFFKATMAESGYTKLALAHNRNDRVETFLLHLLRGAGAEGLTSMAPVSGATIRPLIELGRPEIENYLRSRDQSWQTDETNLDASFARNRLRHIVIPALSEAFNPKLIETLARTVELLESEDDWMRCIAEKWLTDHAITSGRAIHMSAAALAAEPVPLVRRIIREALRQKGSTLKDVAFDHIENVRELLEPGKSGKTVEIPGGLVAMREFDKLTVADRTGDRTGFAYELAIPGSVRIPELGRSFRAEIVERPDEWAQADRVFADGERLGACVKIRSWKPGDYYKPQGLPAGKLKKLFQRARIPRSQRSRWPVFEDGSAIVWVASFPISREFAPSERTQKIVAFEALPD